MVLAGHSSVLKEGEVAMVTDSSRAQEKMNEVQTEAQIVKSQALSYILQHQPKQRVPQSMNGDSRRRVDFLLYSLFVFKEPMEIAPLTLV